MDSGTDLTTTPAIEVRNVSKSFRLPHQQRTTFKEYFLHPFHRTYYEHQLAVDDVSFDVRAGEFFGIVGPNGSGKSTLLKIMAGIYRQDDGEVNIAGLVSPFIELGVGFSPELTARDNVRINSTLLGLRPQELQSRYESIVEFAGLERFMDQKLKNFSSGMQARLAYSIAIQVDFDVLLLDEVLAVGDQDFHEKCFSTFRRFRSEGKTIVLVTHDVATLEEHADRVLLLRSGRMEVLGDPREVIERYQGELGVYA
jgi:ABC-type polysaccharide/polyol phosphate transport system ATPase subunit